LKSSRAEESLLPQAAELASRLGPELLLVRLDDGWVARNSDRLKR